MNSIAKLLIIVCAISFTACDYLDIVPDEKATEQDAFKNAAAAERYLYACYSVMPNPRQGTKSLDLWIGDEVVTPWENNDAAALVQGMYTPSKTGVNEWDDMYKGIRLCYLLKENLGSVPGLSSSDHDNYMAEADFLIAYYHFFLLRAYGPIILVKELQDLNLDDPASFLGRSPFDECAAWIAQKFKDAADCLPIKWTGSDYGRATSVAAMALRARLLLYAASPQFNGGEKFRTLYQNFKNPDGTQMISITENPEKWKTAKEACWEAIQLAESAGAGHSLYEAQEGALTQTPEPQDLTLRSLRFMAIDKDNTKEVIWAYCGKEGSSSFVQKQSLPRWSDVTWGGTATTLNQVLRFYTKNGLPIDEDPNYPKNIYEVTTFPAGDPNGEGETLMLHTQREPRFYAWVAFHNGYYEVFGEDKTTTTSPYYTAFKRANGAKSVTQFLFNQNAGRTDRNTGSFSGYLNKKGVNPGTSVSKSLKVGEFPWPLIRLGELYLNYAEACVESGDLETAKIYLNKIRKRAGIPDVEVSWAGIATLDQNKLREIVHREREIELYFENHSIWDKRRWGIADELGKQPLGLNVMERTNLAKLGTPTSIDVPRNFIPGHYLYPIPIAEINKNPNMVQNPGYGE